MHGAGYLAKEPGALASPYVHPRDAALLKYTLCPLSPCVQLLVSTIPDVLPS